MNIIWSVGYPLTFAGSMTEGRSREWEKEEGKAVAVVLYRVCSLWTQACSAFLFPCYSAESQKQKAKPVFKVSFLIWARAPLCCPTSDSLSLWIVQEGSAVNCFIVLESLDTYICEYKLCIPVGTIRSTLSGNLPYIFSSYEFSVAVLWSQNIWLLDSKIGWQVSALYLETH